ncbi:hypothetical protein M501DRAFT_1016911 [Patellaria atrata CBS 101060]|uniref:Zn(2)-C6 fungal-type domain-containing protein n=1 Tax=Patellaria atrata CBS 101060 TaxID=1346257 RepID=A0A9P4SA37_9PEZI|nr:hypothetical protein M501DRAFT_1016911 [Patellaria atrata CBS 101060]
MATMTQTSPRRSVEAKRELANSTEDTSSPRIAHTLTACCRCRARKTRCDPGLPRCSPCERTNSHCEYYDPTKGQRIPRNYVVHLQHKVRRLEKELADLEKDDQEPDPEDVMRGAAAVRTQDSNESKFLGPSSGIAITRLVMQLAKQFNDSKSITEIVPNAQARLIKERFAQEEAKPTSKVYPLISDVAAEDLPNRDLTDLLVQLFYVKVHAMYPVFHEPTFTQDVEDVYNGSTNPHKNFCVRMVIAISLQKMDTQYAGLADSYYLAALKYFEGAVRTMDLRTLQCFVLIGGYSLLTPTRTAVYYIIGLAVRLTQALGMNEEKTITRGRGGKPANCLEVDMRRKLFWSVMVMELGLSHSLGRPSILATHQDHFDVGWFEMCDDQYITPDGILPEAQPTLKKWVCIHFYKMRLLQLEIRRKLYQKKRQTPKDDQDPWFKQMEQKLTTWREATPENDSGSPLTKKWFTVRCNTMIVFMFRPSPQVPKPSLMAAQKCFEASKFNLHAQRNQMETGAVDLTWIFTQAIFMAINTILWSLSYSEVRREHPREEVEGLLRIGLDSINMASERWPGVLSALGLYEKLIEACLKVYDKDGDVLLSASSPSDSQSVTTPGVSDGPNRSRTTSPASAYTPSLATPPEQNPGPFGFILPPQQSSPASNFSVPTNFSSSPLQPKVSPNIRPVPAPSRSSANAVSQIHYGTLPNFNFDPNSTFNPLPTSLPEAAFPWNPQFSFTQGQEAFGIPAYNQQGPMDYASNANSAIMYPDYYGIPSWTQERPGMGLNQEQRNELLQSLETSGTGQLESMIQQSNAIFSPQIRGY